MVARSRPLGCPVASSAIASYPRVKAGWWRSAQTTLWPFRHSLSLTYGGSSWIA